MRPEHFEDTTGRRIRQLSLLLPNQTGILLQVTKRLETVGIRICALSILDSADHCVVRLILDRPEDARQPLEQLGHRPFETDILGVVPAPGQAFGIRQVLSALLFAEVNVQFAYPLIIPGAQRLALALYTDDLQEAARILCESDLDLIDQVDLE